MRESSAHDACDRGLPAERRARSAHATLFPAVDGEGRGTLVREPLGDHFGRTLTYLRVSVTERCNMRCEYCTLPGLATRFDRDELLGPAEFDRLLAVFQDLGIRHVRFTGGEPLIYPDLVGRIAQARALGFSQLSLTTNGYLLARHAAAISAAGLDRINVSLDSLDRERYARITCGGDLRHVLRGLDRAREVIGRIKLNVVLLRDRNLDELPTLVAFAIAQGFDIQFIETMPLGAAGKAAIARSYASVAVAHARIAERYALRPLPHQIDRGPAQCFQVEGTDTHLGFVSPISDRFCESCNRLRLTATGRLVYCLGQTQGVDLREPLRAGEPPERLAALIRTHVWRDKPERHEFSEDGLVVPVRMMAIGG